MALEGSVEQNDCDKRPQVLPFGSIEPTVRSHEEVERGLDEALKSKEPFYKRVYNTFLSYLYAMPVY